MHVAKHNKFPYQNVSIIREIIRHGKETEAMDLWTSDVYSRKMYLEEWQYREVVTYCFMMVREALY